jgi:hypothetical protein
LARRRGHPRQGWGVSRPSRCPSWGGVDPHDEATFTPSGVRAGLHAARGCPLPADSARVIQARFELSTVCPEAGVRPAIPLSMTGCRWRAERMVSRPAYRPHVEDAVARERPNRRKGAVSSRPTSPCSLATTRYELHASSSLATTCSTSAARTVSSIDAIHELRRRASAPWRSPSHDEMVSGGARPDVRSKLGLAIRPDAHGVAAATPVRPLTRGQNQALRKPGSCPGRGADLR